MSTARPAYPMGGVQTPSLCPQLYSILKQRFGDVAIANEGEAMSAVLSNRGGRKWLDVSHAGEYLRVNCPFCGDTRKRLWINHMYGQPGADNTRLWFLAICYNEDCLSRLENRRALEDMIFGFRNAKERRQVFQVRLGEKIDTQPLSPRPWPGRCIPAHELPDEHPLIEYFVGQRGVSRETLCEYDVRYCAEAPAEPRHRMVLGRAVIPIVMDGMMVGWQARYLGETNNHFPPKYFTLPGFPKRRVLYNYDRARRQPFPVLVEGPTDVWSVGPHGVAAFGKTLSDGQRQLLLRTWPTGPIVVILDGAAWQESRDIVEELQSIRPHLALVPVRLPEEYDPGSLPSEVLWAAIRDAAASARVELPSGSNT